MKSWTEKGLKLLEASLDPPQHELNELDWKTDLSAHKQRLTEHLSAFSNLPGGGFLVFGINPKGIFIKLNETQVSVIITQLANLGRDALEPPVCIDHTVVSYKSGRVLFIHIPESSVKPVHLRGKDLEHSYIRSGGSTRLAARQKIGSLLLHSRTPRWEELRASILLTGEQCTEKLKADPILKMLKRPIPTDNSRLLSWLVEEGFVIQERPNDFYVTNLGAISAAWKLSDFVDLSRKAVRVIVYDGVNKAITKHEQEGKRGYAVTFQGLIKYVTSELPHREVIEGALRKKHSVYPEIALREIIANALIHQDFSISGAGPLIEIFDNRIEISNPGNLLPSKRLDRLIGTQPESRNERLARSFRRYGICEEQGAGLLKAGLAVELYGLPPIHFAATQNHFKVTLSAPRPFARMSQQERLAACYQHTLLKYCSEDTMTNKSLRERLRMPEKQSSMVSVLIRQAVAKNLIKSADPENKSLKFAKYIPAWA
jgi:ATP-dependent DNA helicase RecG